MANILSLALHMFSGAAVVTVEDQVIHKGSRVSDLVHIRNGESGSTRIW